jgi:hypothetical protein
MEGIALFICSVVETVSHANAVVEGRAGTNNNSIGYGIRYGQLYRAFRNR